MKDLEREEKYLALKRENNTYEAFTTLTLEVHDNFKGLLATHNEI